MSIEEPRRIVALVVMSIAGALFGWLAVARRSGATLGFDLAVRAGVHGWASPAMTVIVRVVAAVGSPVAVSVFFAIAMLAFHRVGWRRAAVTLAEVMVGAAVCNVGLKHLIHAPRPQPFVGRDPSSYSFPSGHALYSLCFYGVLASVLAAHTPERATRSAIWVATAVLVAGVGMSRVYLGVHYPSDVIAGYLGAAFVISAVFAFSPGWA